MQNDGEHKHRANLCFGSFFGRFLFVSILKKIFWFFFYLPLMRFKLQLRLVLKDTHYPQPRGWESQHVVYESLHFK